MPTKTTTQNGADVKAEKKTVRKVVPTTPKKTISRKKAEPIVAGFAETLYTAEPNPYHAPVPPYLWIDYPQQNEALYSAHYVIRLGVGGAETVELSIDQGAWQPCRSASGYWWFDWTDAAPGAHTLVARMKAFNGEWFRTPERKVARLS